MALGRVERGELQSAPASEEWAKQKLAEYQYASVMDYGARFNSDVHGLGKYDTAAIRFGYGQLIDLMPAGALSYDTRLANDVFLYGDMPLAINVFAIPILSRIGVRKSSFAISKFTVCVWPRLVSMLIRTGIIFGACPNLPKTPVARSCVIDPTMASGTASLNELFMLGTTVTTCDSDMGRSDEPSPRNGWPKA